MSAAALGFTACDDYEEVAPQSNPQQTIMSVDGLEVALTDAMKSAIDLGTMEGDSIEMITTTATPELNEGVYFNYNVEIAADEAFTQVQNFALSDEGKLYKGDLDNAFRTMFGKTPNARTMYFRFVPYMTDGSSRVLFKKDTYLAATSQQVTPVSLGIVVEDAYYIVTDSWFGAGWENTLIQMEHSDADVYDDAQFTATIDVPADGFYIMAASDVQKALADPGNEFTYTFNPFVGDDGSMWYEGDLQYGTGTPFSITTENKFRVTIDMLERTYSLTEIIPTLYIIGDFCGWNWDNATEMVPGYDNVGETGKFWSVVYIGSESGKGVKFNGAREWDGNEFGYSDVTLVSTVEGVSFVDDGGNIGVSKSGWYIIGVEKVANGTSYDYTVNLFPANVYVYGDCTGGLWEDRAEWLFTVPATADGEFVSPALAADGALRLCVHPMNADGTPWIGDWWKSEFIFYDGKIAYRGKGGDQAAVQAQAGQQVYLNFTTGDARAE